LTLEPGGYLARVTNPSAESVVLSYSSDGVLTSLTDPRGNIYSFEYDSLGRLTRYSDPAGGVQTLVRTEIANGYRLTRTSTLGRTTIYQFERLLAGGERRVVTLPTGATAERTINADRSHRTRFADGTVVTLTLGSDPRFGMQ